MSGIAEPGFELVQETFTRIADSRPDVNAAVAAYAGGRLIVDLWSGPDYRKDSLQAVHSCTKGAMAAVLALLIQRGLIDPDAPVAEFWPEFAAGGKAAIPVRWLASHQAGLVNVDGGFGLAELIGHTALADRLAAQEPWWEPGKGHGYHAYTVGTLVGELVRRVTGQPLGAFFAREIAEPYGIDLFIGLPESQEHRIVAGRPLAMAGGPPPESLPFELPPFMRQAVNMDRQDFPSLFDLVGLREFRAADIPGANGLGSARGLARLYAACIGALGDQPPLLTAETVRTVSATQVAGPDLVVPAWTEYALGFMTPIPGRVIMAGTGSFGHDGAGGGMGYANPELGLAFGYTTDTPPMQGGCDPVTADLTVALLRCTANA